MSVAMNHQADCDCERCTIPLLQDLPPMPPKGRQARSERVARIFAEVMAERRAQEQERCDCERCMKRRAQEPKP